MTKHTIEDRDGAYLAGRTAAFREVHALLAREIGFVDETLHPEQWALERADIVILLRTLCDEHGDNDWPDDLHLGDVLEKHLLPYLLD